MVFNYFFQSKGYVICLKCDYCSEYGNILFYSTFHCLLELDISRILLKGKPLLIAFYEIVLSLDIDREGRPWF